MTWPWFLEPHLLEPKRDQQVKQVWSKSELPLLLLSHHFQSIPPTILGLCHPVFHFKFLVLVARLLWRLESTASSTLVKGLRSYVKVLRHLFKSITEFLSFSSKAVVCNCNFWLNRILQGQLKPLVLPHQPPHWPKNQLSLSVNMPVTTLPIPVFPPTYQQDNFAFAKIWDGLQTELHQVPGAEFQAPPQDVVEMTFAHFQTPREVTLPETVHTWKILETLEDGARWVMMVGPHFQSHHLPPLDRIEANASDHMCFPFQIRPCKTRAQAMCYARRTTPVVEDKTI